MSLLPFIDSLQLSRRAFLPAAALVTAPNTASAFVNGTPASFLPSKTPRQPGPAPKDLGMKARIEVDGELGLASCKPGYHCFTTTADMELDYYFALSPWEPPKALSMPLVDIAAVIDSYPPGQQNVDGGGFEFVERGKDYVYVIFESEKKGFRDDVEFALCKDNKVAVRSSSRLGYLDFGVNARRLNYISEKLREKGWNVPAITRESHSEYYDQNNMR